MNARRSGWRYAIAIGVILGLGFVTGGIGALFLIAMLVAANRTGRTS